MSSDPLNIGDEDATPLWLGWYAGPRRADGGENARVSLVRGSVSVDMSVEELTRLVHTAGVARFLAIPYGSEAKPTTHDVLGALITWGVEGGRP